MHDCPTCHIVWGGWLCSYMLIQLRDGGEPPLTVLEGEGKPGFWLMPPGLGLGTFSWLAPLKGLLFASLHLLCPRLAIARSTCLHGSRCGEGGNRSFSTLGLANWSLRNGGLHNRNLHDGSLRNSSLCNRSLCHWSLCHRSLCDRSRHSSRTRPTGARDLGIRLHLQFLAGLTGSHLGPSGQGGSHQVQTLMEAALLSYYPMIVAPFLDPSCEARETIQVEAGGLIEEVLDVGHKVHQPGFLEGQSFHLMLEEVVKELLLNPRPFCLPKGGNAEPVVDLEDMLQVLPPSPAIKICCQPHGITEGRPWPTSSLRLGSFRCWWRQWDTRCQPGGQIALLTRRLHTLLPQYTSWATDRSAATSPPSCARSSMVLWIGATHGGGFICKGVRNDSPPHGLLWQLYRLLVGHGWMLWAWLSERRHHLGHAQCQRGWCWHPLGQSAWTGHPHNPLRCAPQPVGPPDPREVWWGLRRQQPPFGEVYGREAWWGW